MGSHFEEVAAALAEEKRLFVEKWRAEKERADTAEKERDREKEQAQISEEGFASARLTIAEMVSEKIALEAERDSYRARDGAARAMLTQLRAALDEDSTFLGAVLRVEMDKWLAGGGDRG